MTTLSQFAKERFRVNGGSLFEAYVEEVEDEDLFADKLLIKPLESVIKATSCIPGVPLADEYGDAISKLHEVRLTVAGVYAIPSKRKRSQSPPNRFLWESVPAAKKHCCQLSDIGILPTEDCVNTTFEQTPVLALKSKTEPVRIDQDRSKIQEHLRLVEIATLSY